LDKNLDFAEKKKKKKKMKGRHCGHRGGRHGRHCVACEFCGNMFRSGSLPARRGCKRIVPEERKIDYHRPRCEKNVVACEHCKRSFQSLQLEAHIVSCSVRLENERVRRCLHVAPLSVDANELNLLRKSILDRSVQSPLDYAGADHVNLLAVGLAGAGKSSLLNSLCTALAGDGHVKLPFRERGGMAHGTVSFDWRQLDCIDADVLQNCKLRALDLWGATADDNVQLCLEAALIMEGMMPNGYKHSEPLMLSGPGMLSPSIARAPHALVFVVDGHNYDADRAYQVFSLFSRLASAYSVPCVAVVTKIDELDATMVGAPHTAYTAASLIGVRSHVAKSAGLPLGDVHLLKSYKQEQVASAHVDANVLRLADSVLTKARAYLNGVRTGATTLYAGAAAAPVQVQASTAPASSSSSPA
jgi:GTPase SAR1 family protein